MRIELARCLEHQQQDGVAALAFEFTDPLGHITRSVDLAFAGLGDDVAGLQTLVCRGAVGLDLGNHRALELISDLVLGTQLIVER